MQEGLSAMTKQYLQEIQESARRDRASFWALTAIGTVLIVSLTASQIG